MLIYLSITYILLVLLTNSYLTEHKTSAFFTTTGLSLPKCPMWTLFKSIINLSAGV